jgi:archaellum component FlaC
MNEKSLRNLKQFIADSINRLSIQMDERFRMVDERFEKIDERFERIDQRFESIDERFESIDQHFEKIDQRFESIDERFERIDQKIDNLSETTLGAVDDISQVYDVEIDGIKKRVTKLEHRLAT